MSNQTVVTDTIQVVTFTIAEQTTKKGNYAVPIEQVKEIRTVDSITEIPKSKSYVKGIMNLRGKIIPIIDVNGKIGLESTQNDSAKQRILVADVNDTLTGLLVDEVNEVMRLPSKDIEPPPKGAFESNSYIKGIAKRDEKLIVLLDVLRFLETSNQDIADAMESSVDDTKSVDTSKESSENDKSNSNEDVLPEIEAVIEQESTIAK